MQDFDFALILITSAQISHKFLTNLPKLCPKNFLGDASAAPTLLIIAVRDLMYLEMQDFDFAQI